MINAARTGRTGGTEIVKILLERGANPSTIDAKNKDALYYAQSRENPEMVKMLEEAIAQKK